MKSPAASSATLQKVELESDLLAWQCPETKGHYLPAACYWRWLSKHPERLPQIPLDDHESATEEQPEAVRICPESGLPMQRYRVGHGFRFLVDRSPTGGIWLDEGEWEALRARNFHDELHLIFTQPWQRKARHEEQERQLNELLKSRVGEDAFQRASAFRDWLKDHPDANALLGFVSNGLR